MTPGRRRGWAVHPSVHPIHMTTKKRICSCPPIHVYARVMLGRHPSTRPSLCVCVCVCVCVLAAVQHASSIHPSIHESHHPSFYPCDTSIRPSFHPHRDRHGPPSAHPSIDVIPGRRRGRAAYLCIHPPIPPRRCISAYAVIHPPILVSMPYLSISYATYLPTHPAIDAIPGRRRARGGCPCPPRCPAAPARRPTPGTCLCVRACF